MAAVSSSRKNKGLFSDRFYSIGKQPFYFPMSFACVFLLFLYRRAPDFGRLLVQITQNTGNPQSKVNRFLKRRFGRGKITCNRHRKMINKLLLAPPKTPLKCSYILLLVWSICVAIAVAQKQSMNACMEWAGSSPRATPRNSLPPPPSSGEIAPPRNSLHPLPSSGGSSAHPCSWCRDWGLELRVRVECFGFRV